MNSNKKKAIEYSPFGKKSKEAANRRFSKRKTSKSLLDIFERESISSILGSDTTETDSSFQLETSATEAMNPDFHPNLSKRFKLMNSTGSSFKFIDWENEENKEVLIQQISPPIDWDDTAARSSFDSPFITKETMNKRISNVYPVDFSHLNNICGPSRGKRNHRASNPIKSISTKLPKDFRLATKLRLVSEKPFPWLEKINTPGTYPVNIHISPGDYEKAINLNLDKIDSIFSRPLIQHDQQLAESPLVYLQAAAIYHQFPTIGSVPLFPRRNIGSSRSTLKSANLQSIEANFIDELNRHWRNAFDYLFCCWLSGSRKSFYLCSPQFTVLFVNLPSKIRKITKTPTKTPQKRMECSPRKPTPKMTRTPIKSINNASNNFCFGSPQVKSPRKVAMPDAIRTTSPPAGVEQLIVVTPTTTGFRQMLQKNAIHFSLPFKAEFVDISQEECPKDFLPTEEDGTADLDHDEWLREIGISPKSTLRLKRSASELDAQHIDGESSTGGSSRIPADFPVNRQNGTPPMEMSRSTILIRGPNDAEGFYKLLISQPQLINTKTGPQTGLPPTLISNSPFRHSTQNELTMNSQLVKKTGQVKYMIEMDNGPIIPNAVELLFAFLRKMSATGTSPNRVQLQLIGHNQCNGMNEALNFDKEKNLTTTDADGKQIANFSEIEWDSQNNKFEYL